MMEPYCIITSIGQGAQLVFPALQLCHNNAALLAEPEFIWRVTWRSDKRTNMSCDLTVQLLGWCSILSSRWSVHRNSHSRLLLMRGALLPSCIITSIGQGAQVVFLAILLCLNSAAVLVEPEFIWRVSHSSTTQTKKLLNFSIQMETGVSNLATLPASRHFFYVEWICHWSHLLGSRHLDLSQELRLEGLQWMARI